MQELQNPSTSGQCPTAQLQVIIHVGLHNFNTCFFSKISGGVGGVGGTVPTNSANVLIGEIRSCISDLEETTLIIENSLNKKQLLEQKIKSLVDELARDLNKT